VGDCIRRGKALDELTVAELSKHSDLFGKDAVRLLRHSECVARKKSKGSTSHKEVAKALKMWGKKLGGRG
jgi:argininosuccinate lyase